MNAQRIRVISSPSSSTMGLETLIFAIFRMVCSADYPGRRTRPDGGETDESLHDQAPNGVEVPRRAPGGREGSREVADSDFPEDIRWIRSYVIDEEGGTLGTL